MYSLITQLMSYQAVSRINGSVGNQPNNEGGNGREQRLMQRAKRGGLR
jgi:hypothetical protein